MLYQRRSFTLPATNTASQKNWDRAFMSREDFVAKYGEEPDTDAGSSK